MSRYGFGFGPAGGGGGGGRPTLNLRDLATWQALQSDPNNLLQSITMVGRYLKPVLQNPGVVSPAPNQGWSVSVPLVDLLGQAATPDPLTMLNQILLQTLDDDPVGTDVTIGVGFGNGPPNTIGGTAALTEGLALALIKSGTDHKLRKYVMSSGGSWTATDATAVSASCVGGRLVVSGTNSSLQRACSLVPIDTNGNPISTSNVEPVNTASSTMNLAWTHLFVWAGWQTGAGGSAGVSPTIRGSELLLKLSQLQKYERANPPS